MIIEIDTEAPIAEQIAKLNREIEMHRGKMNALIAVKRSVQQMCKHPNSYTYTVMGDPGTKCPDCGWAT